MTNSLTPKTLLVLAASQYQLDAIRAAKRLGMRVITTDNVPGNPGHILADISYSVDTTDEDAVLAIARTEKIDGVISPCTDVAVATASYVAAELGLPGVPLDAARILTDKVAFRRYLAGIEFPAPQFHEVRDERCIRGISFAGGKTWILKPDRSSGSKGIFIVRSEQELVSRLPESREFRPTSRVVVEEFLCGNQGTCEGVLKGGEIQFHLITDRQTAYPPFVTTTGHVVPSSIPDFAVERLLSLLRDIWARLGISNTVFDCDFVWAEGEIYLIEMTPRLGGNSISQLSRYATGFDLVEYAVKQACGIHSSLPLSSTTRHVAVQLLGVWREGKLSFKQSEVERLRSEPWVLSLKLDQSPGVCVQSFINGRHRVGEAFVVANSRMELEKYRVELFNRLEMTAL